ncbi:hypothetical protein A2257_03770 [Candidatus Falkowbacteria bacterium RIFOXYA2_FULL_38_12]|uniref:Uncharacterized protein n=1 Tax=Candidatus Falkowbacteria bacterium RIFOXYA2_FULL_38_12 TaxID=1797993 RepID=A0A1F5S1B0_9BACT|nr:MAG: hypothetical protein A2257_03770 [Candidatus Falkowbacteria bacterium RIFOXYA2_FULL_38_12]OGF44163.1 MAG: hypothetical protein A2555_02125 [Candidatus Falkowbacteria bacterium RIFOXYD2_FULL_39_16]
MFSRRVFAVLVLLGRGQLGGCTTPQVMEVDAIGVTAMSHLVERAVATAERQRRAEAERATQPQERRPTGELGTPVKLDISEADLAHEVLGDDVADFVLGQSADVADLVPEVGVYLLAPPYRT